ncbi:MAG: 30S ribosomal protein S4 [Candidatus Woesearchaeota archaeon]
MGDPKKPKKKYSTPPHPWMKERIEQEKVLTKEYAFKNKKEIWKLSSLLKKYSEQAKKSIISNTKQGEIEKTNLINKLTKLGLIQAGGQIDDILSLKIKDFCERRLQTLVCRKGLARSMNQSRQFIVHGHISIGSNKLTSPSYLVSIDEEAMISFSSNSELAREDHPERNIVKK